MSFAVLLKLFSNAFADFYINLSLNRSHGRIKHQNFNGMAGMHVRSMLLLIHSFSFAYLITSPYYIMRSSLLRIKGRVHTVTASFFVEVVK